MYEVLAERRRGPFGVFRQITKLDSIEPDQTLSYRRANKLGVWEVVEVRMEGEFGILKITAPEYPVIVKSIKDLARIIPTIITPLDAARPTIRTSSPITVVESLEKGAPKLILTRSEIARFITGSSDNALEAAQAIAQQEKNQRFVDRVWEDRHMDETFINSRNS